MNRIVIAALACGLSLGATTPVLAQGSGKIPITEDLRRLARSDQRLYEAGFVRRRPPPRLGDPAGVVGFNGPPGIIGESVGSYGPLPPGAAGNEDW